MARRDKRARPRKKAAPETKEPSKPTPTRSRLQIGDRFWKEFQKCKGRVSRKKIDETFDKFMKDSNLASLKFQPVVGANDFWKIKVTKSVHVLLRKCKDDTGTFYLAVDLQDHDDY